MIDTPVHISDTTRPRPPSIHTPQYELLIKDKHYKPKLTCRQVRGRTDGRASARCTEMCAHELGALSYAVYCCTKTHLHEHPLTLPQDIALPLPPLAASGQRTRASRHKHKAPTTRPTLMLLLSFRENICIYFYYFFP